MMIRRFHIPIIVLLALLVSCIDDYDPKVSSYENLLVVDGSFSNEAGPHIVRLSLSSNVASPLFLPVTGATVSILDNLGNSFVLAETAAGVYSTEESAKGVVGRTYSIEIVTASGKHYISEPERLHVPVEVDTVYHAVVTRQDPELDYDLYGYEFYVSTREAAEPEQYLKWDVEATYQYQSDYTIRWYFDGELHWFHGPDSLFNCWKTNTIHAIYTAGTNNLSNPVINGFPLNFVSTQTRQLSVRYSLLVKQRTISRHAHDFWVELRKQNGSDASLYSSQPHFVKGNLINPDDPEELVLGYFLVNGVDRMRIFVDRPPMEVPMRYPLCSLSERDFEAYGQMWMMDPVYYPLYAIETPGGRRAMPNQDCVDCRRKGGTIEKPEFWIDP
jgi:hypothetical protein